MPKKTQKVTSAQNSKTKHKTDTAASDNQGKYLPP